jgi:hypothetical protein
MLIKKVKGNKLEERDYSCVQLDSNTIETQLKNGIPKFMREPALLAREILWSVFNWKTKALENFVKEFHPDIIFAPCYSYFHVSKLALHIKKIANCPMISYISDDNYSLKQPRFSLSFWINRIITRKWIRRHFKESSLIYTMTEMQKKEYEQIFNRPMKVLCKSATFTNANIKDINHPIKLIYGGGLYLNRWKVLAEIAKVLEDINQNEVKAQLHIYSGSKLKNSQQKRINDKKNSFLHEAVPFARLEQLYFDSDIAVHVEAFDLVNSSLTRLSFSTKIIDCMNSGCAILAIGPKKQAGIDYLRENDAAICINDIKKIKEVLKKIVDNQTIIHDYSKRARLLGLKNHVKNDIDQMIKGDFQSIILNFDYK